MAEIYLVSNTPSNDESVINLPVSEIKFLKFSLNLDEFDALVATSKNSFKALEFNHIKIKPDMQIYAIGEPCAKAAKRCGFSKIYTAKNSHGGEFAAEISPLLKGKKTLYLRAKSIVSNLGEILKQNGILVSQIVAYESVCARLGKEKIPSENSVLIFSSPSNVKNFILNFGWLDSYKAVAIGETTAKELAKFTDPLVSARQEINACVELAKTLL
ncbi:MULTISPECIES: uroporphyrinogen-III synthase [Campylobacter]|uniref:uroporphyrinogen-III synthase n=1 Tax=Campylobacter TaxID=194 RepID=UPI00146FFB19|nr:MULTISPECIES: uroporphyrinogen-III synthase [Campylobacter]MBN7287474.1 uroporphyrinogen-III synthase [Campylobacter curvus]MDU6826661.1 uroporphyrinogen-III synthase [Campylobacter sp.]